MTSTPCPKCGTMPNDDGTWADYFGLMLHDPVACRDVLHAQLTAERAKVEETRKFIDAYGAHDPECGQGSEPGIAGEPCSCGYDAALEKLRGQ